MADDANDRSVNQRQRRGLLPPELTAIVKPSFQVGCLAGSIGLVSGVTAGIVRDTAPAVFGLISGAQWFALGSSYWFSRSVILTAWGGETQITSGQKVQASALAGGTAGMVGGLLRGPKNIIPATIVFTVVGGAGQAIVGSMQGKPSDVKTEKKSFFQSKWSPLRKLTDEEYREMLDEKILKIDTEIALIDDKIAELRAAKAAEPPDRSDD